MTKPNQPRTTEPYKVGYGRPPKANRFRKGRSGNPRGRKAGEENVIALFKRIAARLVKVNDNGQIKSLSLAEAIILQNYKAALQKNQNAVANMFRLAEEADEFKDWNDAAVAGKPIIFPSKLTQDEFCALYDVNVVRVPSSHASSPERD